MLKINEINKVLSKQALCNGHLIQRVGMTTEYCAMGALARACGVSDEQLCYYPSTGYELYEAIAPILLQKFGIEDYKQFGNLMNANDNSANSATRNTEVKSHVVEMTMKQVEDLFADAALSTEQVSS